MRPLASVGQRAGRSLTGAFVVLCLAAASAAAQQRVIAGTVVDPEGAAVPGARIEAVGDGAVVRSDGDGRFTLRLARPGAVAILVEAPGFAPARRTLAADVSTAHIVLARRAAALGAVRVEERPAPGSVRPAPERLGTLLAAGARSEVVTLEGTDANLAEKVGRQLFARVPGIQVYDMDGAGNQTNVSTRGLDPHRSWEFNVRQDGVPVNSDIYGYPASHYSAPMEAIERVELVRGTASLQYGAQFGGLLNYVTRRPDTTRALGSRSVATSGAFGLVNLYTAAGGRVGTVDYQAYAARREADGFRDASRSRYDAQFVSVAWQARASLRLHAQAARSSYLHRLPGPLTDAMFERDPRTATRSRNWFSPTITIPALRIEWTPGARTRLVAQASAVTGDRSSVLFVGFATVADTPQTATGLHAPRAVDIDGFDSRTFELRLTHEHTLRSRRATLAAGAIVLDNRMRRRQQGPGSRGADYDLRVTGPFGRDLRYLSRGFSVYAEELLQLTGRWRVIPGMRLETGRTRMRGRLAYSDPADTPRDVSHDFPLLGLRTEYAARDGSQWYAGWSEAYRPMLLKDLLPENALEVSDPAMRDARGWTVEAGRRGGWRRLRYDVGAFWMRYDGRFGALLRNDGAGDYLFKTNVGSSRTVGIEAALDAPLVVAGRSVTTGFLSASLFDATYREGVAVRDGANVSLVGNAVEGVPRAIVRAGLAHDRARTSLGVQLSHTSASFGDPLNTRTPNATGARGLVPAHTLVDVTGSRQLGRGLRARAGITNLLDARYFTKRPAFYPGPGVWPSDGRGFTIGVELVR